MDLRNWNPKPRVKKIKKQPDLHYRISKKQMMATRTSGPPPLEELKITRSVQCLPKKQISRSPPLRCKARRQLPPPLPESGMGKTDGGLWIGGHQPQPKAGVPE